MASTQNLLIFVALVTTLLVSSESVAESRSLYNPSTKSLVTRLKLEGEPSNCWESLFQLQACSGEIITFFLNGETYLGHGCCQAIRVIGHDCWPNIVNTLGFTTEETDVLEGYCDEAVHSPPPPEPLSEVKPEAIVP
ncbi:egg cell-secreted protein 1.1-like [Gastrolobium bilobum]|uniref:egg cell-secreted protein 1.1-like n=1 Tax=Gastrolobium bilobum TaxID=150636 RepID=UPI002AAFEBC5|nr:egg cell-secreted protein 1.1-like [Gastrolobium bilobum]